MRWFAILPFILACMTSCTPVLSVKKALAIQNDTSRYSGGIQYSGTEEEHHKFFVYRKGTDLYSAAYKFKVPKQKLTVPDDVHDAWAGETYPGIPVEIQGPPHTLAPTGTTKELIKIKKALGSNPTRGELHKLLPPLKKPEHIPDMLSPQYHEYYSSSNGLRILYRVEYSDAYLRTRERYMKKLREDRTVHNIISTGPSIYVKGPLPTPKPSSRDKITIISVRESSSRFYLPSIPITQNKDL